MINLERVKKYKTPKKTDGLEELRVAKPVSKEEAAHIKELQRLGMLGKIKETPKKRNDWLIPRRAKVIAETEPTEPSLPPEFQLYLAFVGNPNFLNRDDTRSLYVTYSDVSDGSTDMVAVVVKPGFVNEERFMEIFQKLAVQFKVTVKKHEGLDVIFLQPGSALLFDGYLQTELNKLKTAQLAHSLDPQTSE